MTPEFIALIHAVWAGVCVMIPVPFFDEWAAAYFRRRMVRELARVYDLQLTPREVVVLSEPESAGCLQTLLVETLGGVIKRILRQVFFVVELQRAAHNVSHDYYYGYLLAQVFARGVYRGGDLERAGRVQRALMAAKHSANTQLVANLARGVFERGRVSVIAARDQVSAVLIDEYHRGLRRITRWFLQKIAGSPLPIVPVWARERLDRAEGMEERLDRSVLIAKLANLPEIQSLGQDLWQGIVNTPGDHNERLLQRLTEELTRQGVK